MFVEIKTDFGIRVVVADSIEDALNELFLYESDIIYAKLFNDDKTLIECRGLCDDC